MLNDYQINRRTTYGNRSQGSDSEIESVDARKRKLEKLRALLADEETRSLITDPEIMGLIGPAITANGHSGGTRRVTESDTGDLPEQGSLRWEVLEAARNSGKFSIRDIFDRMRGNGYRFHAKKPMISINAAVAHLIEKGFINQVSSGNGRQPAIYEAAKEDSNKKASE